MTPDQRSLVDDLVERRISVDELVERWGPGDHAAVALAVMRDAVDRRDGAQFETALGIVRRSEHTAEHIAVMVEAFAGDWHQRHEEIVERLARRGDPQLTDVMMRAATWVPEYLDWDDARAMATKAIYGLGRTGGERAITALWQLVDDPADPVRECAAYQLGLRTEPWSGDPDDTNDYGDVTRPI